MIDPSQVSQMREQMQRLTANAGITGKLYIDASPQEGFLRLKVVDVINIDPAYLVEILATLLSEVGKGFNLEVKKYVRQGGTNG